MIEKRPLPFKCEILDKASVSVVNPYSGARVMLEPDAIAVFDVIKGAEMLHNYSVVQQGLDWFMKYFPSEYMILLD